MQLTRSETKAKSDTTRLGLNCSPLRGHKYLHKVPSSGAFCMFIHQGRDAALQLTVGGKNCSSEHV